MMNYFWSEDEEYDIKNQLYNDFVINTVNLFKKLGISDIHTFFYVYCYLLNNGYFSIDNSYLYSTTQILDEQYTILLGYGCCRHNAVLLCNIYRKINQFKNVYAIGIDHIYSKNKIDIEIPYCKKDQKCKNDHILVEILKNRLNHKVVLIQDDSNWFVQDPTMLVENAILDNYHLYCTNGVYFVNKNLLKRELKYYTCRPEESLSYLKKKSLSSYVMSCYKTGELLCNNNKDLFECFYEENKNIYEEMKKLCLKKL